MPENRPLTTRTGGGGGASKSPSLLLLLFSIADVVGEGCLFAWGLNWAAFVQAWEQPWGVTTVQDVWVYSLIRLALSFSLPPLCFSLSSREKQQQRLAAASQGRIVPGEGDGGALKTKNQDNGMQGWVESLVMACYAIGATYLMSKAAFLLIFQDAVEDPSDIGRRWAVVGGGTACSIVGYAGTMRMVHGFWKWRGEGGEGMEEPLLEGAGEAGDAKGQGGAWEQLGEKRGVIWRLFALVTPDWMWLTGGLVFLGVAAVTQAIVPKFTGDVINDIVLEKDTDKFVSSLMVLSVVSLATSVASGMRGACFLVCMSRMNVRIRQRAYKSLLSQEIAFFDQTKTGELTSRLSSDTQKMSESISLNLNVFFRSLVQAIGVLSLMAVLQWRLTLVTFMSVPLIVVASKVYGEYYKKLTSMVQDAQAASNSTADETIGTMRTVRSFANEEAECAAYGEKLEKMLDVNMKQAVAYLGYGSFITLAPLITTVTVLYFGGHLVLDGMLKPGDLVSFIFYQQSLSQAINSMGDVWTGLMNAAGAAEKVFAIIDRTPQHTPSAPPVEGDDLHWKGLRMRGHIRFDRVSFSYKTRGGNEMVLDDVSFEALPGQVVALVGKSGSGKSSCISLLENFYEPTSGTITIDGALLTEYSHSYLHQRMSLVGQEPVLYSRSIRDNITYGLPPDSLTEAQVVRAAELASAHEFVQEMPDGYDTQVGERGSQLSGGQKQRIAIARALCRDPAVLLLDEATSALDAESEALVQAAIDRNMQGRTVIIIAHRLSTIRSADKIIVMRKGKVVEEGAHTELVRRGGVYASLVARQLTKEEMSEGAGGSERDLGNYSPPTPRAAAGGGGGITGMLGRALLGNGRGSPSPQKQARRRAMGQGAL